MVDAYRSIKSAPEFVAPEARKGPHDGVKVFLEAKNEVDTGLECSS